MSRSSTKIGVSIFPAKTGFSFWSNGAHQNCAYLWACLRAAGYDVRMLNGGDGEPPKSESLPVELREMSFVPICDETVRDLDVIVQAGAQISAEHVDLVRRRGGAAVSFKFGSDYPIDAERAIHDIPTGSIFNGAKFDEVWTTSQHLKVCGAYWEINYRAPVRVLPHIWAPYFVDQIVAALPAGTRAEYDRTRVKKRIVVLEPNINLIKTCHVPILIAESAFRQAPEKFDSVLVTNAEHLKKRAAFSTFVGNLDLIRAKAEDGFPMISFEGRHNTPWWMAAHGDIVVSHQWLPFANYSHYDLIHMGYPIVHNVPELERCGVGYFYPDFDAHEGARQLLECVRTYDPDLEHAAHRAFLETRIVTSRANVEAHAGAVEDLLHCRREVA